MLAIHANAETGYCYVKQSTLAYETGYKRPTVSVHIQQLRDEGLIDFREQNRGNGYRINHEYLLLFRDGLTWPDGTAPRVAKTNTGHTHSRVSEDNMATSSLRTSPCHSNGHAVSGTRTRRVSEGGSINKQINMPNDKQTANKSLEQTDSAPDSLSECAEDDEGSGASFGGKGKIRRLTRPVRPSANEVAFSTAGYDSSAAETPLERMETGKKQGPEDRMAALRERVKRERGCLSTDDTALTSPRRLKLCPCFDNCTRP
jgi:biotin operon repressor